MADTDQGTGQKPLRVTGKAQSLSDFSTYKFEVVIELPEGEGITVVLRTLSLWEWEQIGLQVVDPPPPMYGVDKEGRPIFNEQDQGYLAVKTTNYLERQLRRLAAALEMDIPGETLAEKAEALRGMNNAIMRQLLGTLTATAFGGSARIQQRADAFHPAANGRAQGEDAAQASPAE